MNDAVTPRDCALAIALPLTESRFLENIRAPEHDYAAYIRSLHMAEGADDSYYWNFVYAPFAAIMNDRCDRLVRRGVTVVRDATLEELRALAARFYIVTFVSHWRFRALQVAEIVDVGAVLGALNDPRDDLARAFHKAVHAQDPEALKSSDEPDRLVGAFNAVLRAGHAQYVTDRREPLLLMNIPPQRLTRAALEKAFSPSIASARAVEFADGMKTTAEVVEAVPVGFDGLLDLTVCNSAILGDVIKTARPSCTVAVNRYPTEPHIRLTLYCQVIDELARRPAAFVDAMARFGKRE